ncbi:anhydro-N-acetylmuramic acid kinase [Algoriphagus namhaensis]
MKNYTVIGLMSGTSGDGLDIAHCRFTLDQGWQYEILNATTIPFPIDLEVQLKSAHVMSGLELSLLDVELGKWMGEQVKLFCQGMIEKPLAVCSHGHTVFHQPKKGLSLQIGNGYWLAEKSEMMAIVDFRMKDITLGGQGAPLVPIGDRLLFEEYDFCLNLGGISNISMDADRKRIAFDCTPFNGLLNHFAKKLGSDYDSEGQWAREGTLNLTLYESLNKIPYYSQRGAKSLGREDMEGDFLPLLEQSRLNTKDILATLTEHFAYQIARAIAPYQTDKKQKLLITGGGAYHLTFRERLASHLGGKIEIISAPRNLIEFKEALIFGFLGVLRLRGENNCLASVTGARQDSCGGSVFDYRPS